MKIHFHGHNEKKIACMDWGVKSNLKNMFKKALILHNVVSTGSCACITIFGVVEYSYRFHSGFIEWHVCLLMAALSPYGIWPNSKRGSLIGAVCQQSSMPVAFQLQVSEHEGTNSTAAPIWVIVNQSDQYVSYHSPPGLQAEHFGIQKTARLQREETHSVKQELQRRKHSNTHKENGRQFR